MPSPCSFSWYELMTTDIAAAASFYSNVVGWTVTDVGGGGMEYSTFNVGGIGIAGLMSLPKDAGPIPAWVGYIHVQDVDSKVQDLVNAGGQLHRGPTDVPGMLRFAVVQDPQGAAFVLFTADPSMPSNPTRPALGAQGTVAWHELMAADGPSAFEFYASQYGWTKADAYDMGPMGVYQTFATGDAPVGGIMTKPPAVPVPSWSFCFHVDGINAAAARITAQGGSIRTNPTQVPGGSWVIQAHDPQGAFFSLLSTTD